MSDNPKYETRVREIAEEMAKADCIPGSRLAYDETVIQSIYVPLARIAVKHMAEEVRLALPASWSKGEKETYLIIRGLVPTPERKEAAQP